MAKIDRYYFRVCTRGAERRGWRVAGGLVRAARFDDLLDAASLRRA